MRLVSALVLTVLVACGPTAKRSNVPESGGALDSDASVRLASLLARAKTAWADRGVRANAEAALDAWSQASAANPGDPKVHLSIARASFFLADGWLVQESKDQAKKRFEEGYMSAETALLLMSEGFRDARKQGASMADAAALLTEVGTTEALLWYASNLGAWVNLEGKRAGLANRDALVSLHQLVLERDPDAHYRAADRFFGAYYAQAPSMFGGSIDKSADHFEQALRKAPDFPDGYLLMAEHFAARTDDKLLFDQLLDRVRTAKPCDGENVHPCVTPELRNEYSVAKRKVEVLAARRSDLLD